MSIAEVEAPPVEVPSVAAPQPHPDSLMLETVHGLRVTAVRLAEERAALAAKAAGHETVIAQRNAELAAMAMRAVQAETDRDALLASCFARQAALTEPASVREHRLLLQIGLDREYAGRLERAYEVLAAENEQLRSQLAVAPSDTVRARPAGRRRRTR